MAHRLTLFFWSKDLDPEQVVYLLTAYWPIADVYHSSYTLPIHSALIDFIGQLLLALAYEMCIWQGRDVMVVEEALR
jgi:solute carrier family 41